MQYAQCSQKNNNNSNNKLKVGWRANRSGSRSEISHSKIKKL